MLEKIIFYRMFKGNIWCKVEGKWNNYKYYKELTDLKIEYLEDYNCYKKLEDFDLTINVIYKFVAFLLNRLEYNIKDVNYIENSDDLNTYKYEINIAKYFYITGFDKESIEEEIIEDVIVHIVMNLQTKSLVNINSIRLEIKDYTFDVYIRGQII